MTRRILSIWILILLSYIARGENDNLDVHHSPQTALQNFYDNLETDNYNPKQAAKSLHGDIVNAQDSAIYLKKILDGKGFTLKGIKIPSDSNYIDSSSLLAEYFPFPLEKRFYLERVNDKWYISYTTIHDIPQMYSEVYKIELSPNNYFQTKFWQTKILGIKIVSLFGAFLLIILCLIIYRVFYYLFKRIDIKNIKIKNKKTENYFLNLGQYLSLYIVSRVFITFLPSLKLPIKWNAFLLKSAGIASVIFLVLVINQLISGLEYILYTSQNKNDNIKNRQVIPMMSKIIRGIVWIIGIFYILYAYLNIDIGALLAGLSIGGLALALAAQDTVKNFMGSAIIIIDKPFVIHDWIEYNGQEGQVVEIGVRSTLLRTADGNNIYIPNSLISNNVLINKGIIKYKNFKTIIPIDYNTPVEKINEFIQGLKQIIDTNTYTHKDNYEVHIFELTNTSINIQFSCFFDVKNRSEEFAARGSILTLILQLGTELHIHIAYPTQKLYLENNAVPNTDIPKTSTK